MKEQDVKQVYKTLQLSADDIGEVLISSEVVASIAGLAALEAEGVQSTIGSMANELAGKLGVRNFGKGVKAVIENDEVNVDMNINMKYGYNILKTSSQVQDKVKQAVESMTGLTVNNVNIYISGVAIDKE
ncbi:MAG: Asp23/Gls24 family envelope stress response protein [Lachnospiraceae bacterium]|nr:Asp23/Gls24 family envelope stress response protein [Lachnospiraceae bacterium]